MPLKAIVFSFQVSFLNAGQVIRWPMHIARIIAGPYTEGTMLQEVVLKMKSHAFVKLLMAKE